MNNFGNFIYKLRKEKSMTQAELGSLLGLTDKAISRWETGESFPETAQLIPLSNLFGITIDELLKGERKIQSLPNDKYSHYSNEDVVNNNSRGIEKEYNREELDETFDTKEKPLSKSETMQLLIGLLLVLFGVVLVICLSYIEHLEDYAVIPFLILIAFAVYQFMMMGFKKTAREKELGKRTETYLSYGRQISIGVMLFITMSSWVLAFSDKNEVIGLIIFFVQLMIGLCFVIIGGSSIDREFKELAKEKKIENKNKKDDLAGAICGVIMLLAMAIYIFLGFTMDMWRSAWVVFPVGGILCGIVSIIVEQFKNNK